MPSAGITFMSGALGCSINRPLDNKRQPRIALEAETILAILGICDAGTHHFVSSDILRFEIGRNPYPQRQAFAQAVLMRAATHLVLTSAMQQRARQLEKAGIKALDSLHLATAEHGHVDYFCTCDDRFLRRALEQTDLRVRIFSPLELAQEVLQ